MVFWLAYTDWGNVLPRMITVGLFESHGENPLHHIGIKSILHFKALFGKSRMNPPAESNQPQRS
jgi:hypothetical protein